ncbi:MAG: NAD(P)/FAD-dependent oxidoreductase [Myxococcales bacterium]|nr:NAD(P)/FAD-dependent oxidoreductase [Myxococcales bacterium]
MTQPDTEVAIVGGGPGGLSAALTLGRALRATVLYDAGAPRNAPAHAAHNVFTRDGTSPLELNRIGREQLGPYTTVEVRQRRVDDAERLADGTFALRDDHGERLTARHLILATGVVDELPPIDGLRELWGTGVFHCPYCHGWEVRDQPFVMIAQGPHALHMARMLRGWTSDLTICPMEGVAIDDAERQELVALGVQFRPAVQSLVGAADGTVQDVVLANGERLGAAAVFTSAPVRQRSPLPEKLGCTLHSEGMFAGLVEVDERGSAGVPGLWVVGDASAGFPQVIAAAHEGSVAGAMINMELLFANELPRGRGTATKGSQHGG